MEVEMKIRGLMMDPVTNMPIVVLKDPSGDAVLPIWVGIYEANAIALEIEKVSTPRPMTHDLMKTLLVGLEAGIQKVGVKELKDDAFFAVAVVDDVVNHRGLHVEGKLQEIRAVCPGRAVLGGRGDGLLGGIVGIQAPDRILLQVSDWNGRVKKKS